MKPFRTILKPLSLQGTINHQDSVMMVGSCFSDNIGKKLEEALFNVDINPFGTTFNPASISTTLNRILENRKLEETDLFTHNGLWHSFDHHSKFSKSDKTATLNAINDRIEIAHNNLLNAKILIITLGTARCYLHNDNIVNNCHKLPANNFTTKNLSVEEVTAILKALFNKIISANPNIKIVLTVSPIRHISDGLAQNQLSKSILRVAIQNLIDIFSNNCIYFPAYEIMLDDLRDYRFYASDMVHPSEVAIEYIYELFAESFFTQETKNAVKEAVKLSSRLAHRSLTDDANIIDAFKASTAQYASSLISKYPYLEPIIAKKFESK